MQEIVKLILEERDREGEGREIKQRGVHHGIYQRFFGHDVETRE